MTTTASTTGRSGRTERPLWSKAICECRRGRHPVIGVLPGEGIGPEIVEATLRVAREVGRLRSVDFEIVTGGPIGKRSVAEGHPPLSDEVVSFCESIYSCGGAILAGAGGDRFVYDLRRRFELFCKLNPLVPHPALRGCGSLKGEALRDVDIMVVRDNSGGVYQGEWTDSGKNGSRRATHSFSYEDAQVRRILQVACALAEKRRGELAVIVKPNGIPTISQLWIDLASSMGGECGLKPKILEVDYAVYALIQSPRSFDVIVTSNMIGDIVADLGASLLGSRGLSFGASYSEEGATVYQTNHGAAYDLAGKDRANPVAQMLSLCMMLHENFGLTEEAALIESAIGEVWRKGFRTFDLMEPGCRLAGTREMTDLVVREIRRLHDESRS